ncbi:hypothetical protein SISSUDRAFT_1067675 [Sistotremastrum suecicum HHB10207 ss-3]|uniref:Uncharacterized protein n=1 Tax=Sistotremastrum suecicum HHB10207 ss-3 TaxID=1314776 RepID=A0A165WUV1_9AGAM|nr:hypothetical protein SISSUDRAFT_1067675 [Sistotremastrum suecicum HHB10207 ss-3]
MSSNHSTPIGVTSFPRSFTEHENFYNNHITEYTPPNGVELHWQSVRPIAFYTNAFIYPFNPSVTPNPPKQIPKNCAHHMLTSPLDSAHADMALFPPANIGQRIPSQCDQEQHELTYLGHVAFQGRNNWMLFIAIDERNTRQRRLVYVWWGTSWRCYINLPYPAPCSTCDSLDIFSQMFKDWETWMKLSNIYWRQGEKILRRLPSLFIPVALHLLYKNEPRRPDALIFHPLYKRQNDTRDVEGENYEPFQRPTLNLIPDSPSSSLLNAIFHDDDDVNHTIHSSAMEHLVMLPSIASSTTLAED